MIDLDEFALCTHEEAETMIFVYITHATKGGSPEGVLIAKASDTDIICIAVSQYYVSSPRNWSTSEKLVYICYVHYCIRVKYSQVFFISKHV